MSSFQGAHCPQDIMLMGVRWSLAYPLSYRHIDELRQARGVAVDHATIPRWGVTYSPQRAEALHRRQRPGWVSWRMDETYSRGKGQWYSLYRAVAKTGQTIAFRLTKHRDERAAKGVLTQAIHRHGGPEKITLDGSAAQKAALKSDNEEPGTTSVSRQVKALKKVVEQDQRGVKRLTRPMLGFKAFEAAPSTLVGRELLPRLRQGQLAGGVEQGLTVAKPFDALAA